MTAQWIAPAIINVTSLETGRVGAFKAGPKTNGILGAYTYSIVSGPTGVSIDADTGTVSLANALAVGSQAVTIQVTDRDDSNSIQFTVHLVVATGVTSNRSGGQVLHKIYTPEQFSGDFVAMGNQIRSDQTTAGDGKLRATIQFQGGTTYTYTNNHWLQGVQYYTCQSVGTGNATLQNTNTTAPSPYDRGPLNLGSGANCFSGTSTPIRNQMAAIASSSVGSSTVTLLNASDASRLKVGMYHAVFSYSQQIGGYPPNCRWIDYVKVNSISGTTVNLDRRLNHAHFSDYWEDPSDTQSIGMARIGPWDETDGSTRLCIRGLWENIIFSPNGTNDITYFESHIYAAFVGCTLSNVQPTMCQHVEFVSSTIESTEPPHGTAGEPDKLSETLVFDNCTVTAYLGGATGWAYWLSRSSTLYPVQIAPREFRDIGSTWNAHSDNYFYVPWGFGYNGPILQADFSGSTFIANGGQPTWTWGNPPVGGFDVTGAWNGNTLQIPKTFSAFQDWLVWAYEGVMVFTGSSVSSPGAYGRVDKIHAPVDGSALWLDITWLSGTKPTTGTLNLPQHGLRKLTWSNGTAITIGGWQDPPFVCQSGTPADRAFPTGIS